MVLVSRRNRVRRLVGYCFVLIYSFVTSRGFWSNANERNKLLLLVFSTVIALEADILFRIFVLLPGQTHWFFYGWGVAELLVLWVSGAFITPIKVVLGVIVIVTLGRQLLRTLEQQGDSITLGDSDLLSN